MTAALLIEGLSFHYPGCAPALRQISLRIERGERVALLGANGAGKSTLLLHLNGLLTGQAGHFEVCGLTLGRAPIQDVRRRVGLVFQSPDDQLFCPTLAEDVAFGPRNLKLPELEVAARVARALTAVGLPGLGPRSAFHLSIGQKKRAALATVLAMDAELLALDEPSSSLDPRGRRELIELLRGLDQTLLISTHDFDLVRALCSRAIVLSAGLIVADRPLDAVLSDHALLAAHGLS